MLFILLALTALFWMIIALDTYRGLSSLHALEKEAPIRSSGKISVIVPARNEEDHIMKSISSQLNQTYQHIEWILINDRSKDTTGTLMEKLAEKDHRITVIHIDKLPEGWLGKNYALHKGTLAASGDVYLFTDADVRYEPDLIAKAAGYMNRLKIAHLTVSPDLQSKSFLLKGFVAFFLFGFSYYKRPWSANRDQSKSGMGIGAFNMIKKEAYQNIGGHQAISLRPDDDLQLGMLVKKNGYKQRMATAKSMLKVEWYPSVKEALKGLEKNTFAGLHYSYLFTFGAMAGVFISQVLPFIAIFSRDANTAAMAWVSIGAIMAVYIPITRRLTTYSSFHAVLFPISAILFITAVIRAAMLTLLRGGVKWRGTIYPIKDLKKKS
ncbi:glycosyltransferase [Jeotgalibacillus haloalkalitolerans]|uniref:4,4'-diaponeurosporenoate glycosyltransferase n=1 Tax=Jeotgalibacillus haloalkalitolerans TaxID=3104292 RepID=A0ABU5KLH2_9BACL|nr:glycosyltransferase family 2 protein [Jeotgalibacillus sp. HH7-29]MDZ5712083.1 glycosyltransferase family 2 protein [Jeotgalibacillus sp. HH7-29]